MHCGVLCDKDGRVKRTWALVNDTAIVPVESGDQLLEWEVDHAADLPHSAERVEKIAQAVKEQERIGSLKTYSDVLQHGDTHQRNMSTQQVHFAKPSQEPIYYKTGTGLHYRRTTGDAGLVEVPVESF